tara:strand:+ start:640 stop:873 length:234 start_codon:yes stop_codon:yes gene_type:complete
MLLLSNVYPQANSPASPGQLYLSASQVANRLGLSRTSIWRYLRDDPNFPQPYRFGKTTRRWSLAEIQEWEQSRNMEV